MVKSINLQIEVTSTLAGLHAQLHAAKTKDQDAIAALQSACALSLFDRKDAVMV